MSARKGSSSPGELGDPQPVPHLQEVKTSPRIPPVRPADPAAAFPPLGTVWDMAGVQGVSTGFCGGLWVHVWVWVGKDKGVRSVASKGQPGGAWGCVHIHTCVCVDVCAGVCAHACAHVWCDCACAGGCVHERDRVCACLQTRVWVCAHVCAQRRARGGPPHGWPGPGTLPMTHPAQGDLRDRWHPLNPHSLLPVTRCHAHPPSPGKCRPVSRCSRGHAGLLAASVLPGEQGQTGSAPPDLPPVLSPVVPRRPQVAASLTWQGRAGGCCQRIRSSPCPFLSPSFHLIQRRAEPLTLASLLWRPPLSPARPRMGSFPSALLYHLCSYDKHVKK